MTKKHARREQTLSSLEALSGYSRKVSARNSRTKLSVRNNSFGRGGSDSESDTGYDDDAMS